MNRLLNWVKANKLAAFFIGLLSFFPLLLIFAALFFVVSIVRPYSMLGATGGNMMDFEAVDSFGASGISPSVSKSLLSQQRMPISPPINDYIPQPNTRDRKVVTESNMSLVVSDVKGSISKIEMQAETLRGYMINSNLSSPEGGAKGSISIRIPVESRTQMVSFLEDLAVRVVSENTSGWDVTDQYVDYQARLTTLNKTKAIYEGLMDKATTFEEVLKAQQQILAVQDQIDAIRGQMQKIEATAATTKITIYLATDELELPYAPEQPWRPTVIFKYAVRGLVGTLRGLGTIAIWIGVYAVIWGPIVAYLKYRRYKRRKAQASQITN